MLMSLRSILHFCDAANSKKLFYRRSFWSVILLRARAGVGVNFSPMSSLANLPPPSSPLSPFAAVQSPSSPSEALPAEDVTQRDHIHDAGDLSEPDIANSSPLFGPVAIEGAAPLVLGAAIDGHEAVTSPPPFCAAADAAVTAPARSHLVALQAQPAPVFSLSRPPRQDATLDAVMRCAPSLLIGTADPSSCLLQERRFPQEAVLSFLHRSLWPHSQDRHL